MNGFLRRLAEQAMSHESPVRSAVRLPFAAAPIVREEQRASIQTMEPAPGSEPLSRQGAGRPVSGMPLPTGRSVRAVRVAGTAPGETPEPLLELTLENSAAHLPDGRARGSRPIGQNHSLATSIIDTSRLHAGDYPTLEAFDEADPANLEAIATSRPPGEKPPVADHLPVLQNIPTRRRLAEPLLPSSPHVYPQAHHGRIAAPVIQERLESSRPTEDSVEVHVSIGRIEVTAVQEAPRAKKEPVAASKPMSLEEYLAKRGGGS